MHQISPSEKSIKAATHKAIRIIGGVEAAAEYVRVGKTALGNYYSVHHSESFVPADVAMTLDELAGYPFIAEALSQAFKPPSTSTVNPHELLSKVIAESGELGALFSDALSDGRVCSKEAVQIKQEAEDLKAAAQRIIDMADALQTECAA